MPHFHLTLRITKRPQHGIAARRLRGLPRVSIGRLTPKGVEYQAHSSYSAA
jgi:hypothetical protein